ncbi:MAG: glycosyltransferase family 4 protein [Anaerolineae bacterium]
MRIGLVSPYDFAYPGGVTKHIANLSNKLQELGHQTIIIAPMSSRNGASPPLELIPLSCFIVPVRYNGSQARLCLSPFMRQTVRRILRQHPLDVIHLHEPTNPTLPRVVLQEATKLSPKTVIVGTFHAYREGYKLNALERLLHRAYRVFCQSIAAQLDGRIAVSLLAREHASRMIPGPYRVIPNGVDVNLFGDTRIAPLPEFAEGLNVLFVGRLEARKGVHYLLEAFARIKDILPQARLLIAGPYSAHETKPLQRLIHSWALRDVHFLGCLSERELVRCYRTAHVFCAPSLGSESFGMVLLEAMAAGLPIVASDIAGYRTVVKHQEEGYLVPPGNVEAIVQALITLLCQPELRRSMAARGRVTAARYTWEQIATDILSFYMDLYTEKRANSCKMWPCVEHPYPMYHRIEQVN